MMDDRGRHARDEEAALLHKQLPSSKCGCFWSALLPWAFLAGALLTGLLVVCLFLQAPAAGASPPLTFLVVGDWGRQGRYNQSRVAHQMGRIGAENDVAFVVSTGDNFYKRGLPDDPSTPLFAESFSNIYTAASLMKPWYAVLGNHDYQGSTAMQLGPWAQQQDSRWHCHRSYQLKQPLCESGCSADTLELFFFDTTPFVKEYQTRQNEQYDWSGLLPDLEGHLRRHLKKLSHSLRASRARWKVVVGHHPVRSFGHHGDTVELVERLEPILEAHGVHVYLNGHDHNLQHIKMSDSAVHYVTSGAGSKAYRPLTEVVGERGLQFGHVGQGFVAVEVIRASARFAFFDVEGKELYSFVLKQ